MSISLPKALLKIVARAEEGDAGQRLFHPYFVQVYEGWAIDDFNQLLHAETQRLYQLYEFDPLEHLDWVTLRMVYRFRARLSVVRPGEHSRLLSSWCLKDPVCPVPSQEELGEELEWTNALLRAFAKGKPCQQVTLEKLHHDYVAQSCEQMNSLTTLLWRWQKAGRPICQEECFLHHSEEKRDFARAAKEQQLNELAARDLAQTLHRSGAPDFLLDASNGAHQRELDILKQIREAMIMC